MVLRLHQYMSTGLDSAGASGIQRVCFLTYFSHATKVRTLEVDLVHFLILLVNDVSYEFLLACRCLRCINFCGTTRGESDICVYIYPILVTSEH